MTSNPYSPPNSAPSDAGARSLIYDSMFLLSAALGVVVLGISVWTGYQNIVFAIHNGGRLPAYTLAVTIVALFCGFAMFYSASRWRKQSVSAGLLSLLGSLIALFVGPQLLLLLLVG